MQIELNETKIDLMRRTIARGASEDELALFIEQVQRTGLDPFARQIYPIRRKQWNSQARAYEESQVIQVSIDGFRLIADRTGKYAGQVGPWWCGADGSWQEVWLAEEAPAAAKLGVLRHDFTQPLYAIAIYKSYVQTNSSKEPVSRWKTDPAGMLAKCAEALALRRAFPQEMSGLYTADEMGQADNPRTPAAGAGEPEAGETKKANPRPYSPKTIREIFANMVAAIERQGLMLGPDDFSITEQALDELTGGGSATALYLNHLSGIPFLEDMSESDIVALLRLLKPSQPDGSFVACQEAHQEFEQIRAAAELAAKVDAEIPSIPEPAPAVAGAPEPAGAGEPEPATKAQAPAKEARPYTPHALPGKIKNAARLLLKNNPSLTETDEQRGLVKQLLETAIAGEATAQGDSPSAARGQVQFFLTGIRSLDKAGPEYIAALRAWLKPTQVDGGEWIIDPMAEREAIAVYQTLKGQSQA